MSKIPFFSVKLLQKIRKNPKVVHKTWSRATTIVPEMIGAVIGVHNGRMFIPVQVAEKMVGHKLGEFALTRKPRQKKGSKKK